MKPSLRDTIATEVMQISLAHHLKKDTIESRNGGITPEMIAQDAYAQADVMLAVRGEETTDGRWARRVDCAVDSIGQLGDDGIEAAMHSLLDLICDLRKRA